MTQTNLFPRVIGAWVGLIGLLLIGVVLLGPYTHGNLAPKPDSDYVRTLQSRIGLTGSFHGPGLAEQSAAPQGLAARGRELMVANGCASCHGPDGQGGPVGKPIVGFTAAELQAKATKGPGGMPAFAKGHLTDSDFAALAAYLKPLKN
ncbi:MAG: cytochrome c [Chloroflexota bacterium]|nr:cytochrome c [Chloroflexota bacterium]